jgi:hypothetical protein
MMIDFSHLPLATSASLDGSLDLFGQTGNHDALLSATQPTGAFSSPHLIFLDAAVANLFPAIDLSNNLQVFRLDANADGIAQITNILKQYQNVGSVHILSHGSEGDVLLGNGHLNLANINNYTNEFNDWRNTLSNDADVLFYGCNVGNGSDGLAFIQQLGNITGADIAASTNATGNAALGGDWELEIATGKIESTAQLDTREISKYQILLADEVLFAFNDFSNSSNLVFNGNASQSSDRLRITPDLGSQRGSVFYNQALAIDANTSFTSQFQFQLSGGQGTNGADGFTFVLQNANNGLQSLGGIGGDLGYRGIDKSIAIEFDTYQNTFDANRNHISILRNGDVTQPLTTAPAPFDLNEGTPLNAWVEYDGVTNNLQVFVSNISTKPATALLSTTIDLAAVVGDRAFLGFTGGTGGLTNAQEIQK